MFMPDREGRAAAGGGIRMPSRALGAVPDAAAGRGDSHRDPPRPGVSHAALRRRFEVQGLYGASGQEG